jgi:hypothetical protein
MMEEMAGTPKERHIRRSGEKQAKEKYFEQQVKDTTIPGVTSGS